MLQSPDLLSFIAKNSDSHAHSNGWWKEHSAIYAREIEETHSLSSNSLFLGEIGSLEFPYVSFGAVNTSHLFGLDELIIFSWYCRNKMRYSNVLDLGANIGLHSLIMAKLGFSVDAYEPDPTHFSLLSNVLASNRVENVRLHQSAVSNHDGQMKFTRVLGNTTGSHLSGAKSAPYGELEEFEVIVEDINKILSKKYDFVKMDVEGHEVVILSAISRENILNTDFMLEIGTSENAKLAYVEIKRLGLNAFTQKTNWGLVHSVEDLPTSHREGSLFLTMKSEMAWD